MNAPAPKRRTKLLAIEPGSADPRKPKVLVFGGPGVGKTYCATSWPRPFYIDTEGGADLKKYQERLREAGGMYLGPEQGSLDFDTVISQIEALATEKHDFQTIIIDSITKLYNTAIVDEQSRMSDAGKKDEYGASKKPAVRQMARLVRWLNRADLNVIIIAHEKDEWGLAANGQREAIGKTFDGWEKLSYELHLVLRVTAIGSGESAKRYAQIGKSRLIGFPSGERFDWTYAEFAKRYGLDVIERAVVQLVLATPEQVAELERLLTIVKLPEGTTEKWLNKAGADTYAEMGTEQIAACIEHLTNTIAKGAAA